MTADIYERALAGLLRDALIWLEQTLHDYRLTDFQIDQAADELIAEHAEQFANDEDQAPMKIAHRIVRRLIPDAELDDN